MSRVVPVCGCGTHLHAKTWELEFISVIGGLDLDGVLSDQWLWDIVLSSACPSPTLNFPDLPRRCALTLISAIWAPINGASMVPRHVGCLSVRVVFVHLSMRAAHKEGDKAQLLLVWNLCDNRRRQRRLRIGSIYIRTCFLPRYSACRRQTGFHSHICRKVERAAAACSI